MVNIHEKRGNHKSKTYNRFTKTRKKISIILIEKKITKPLKEKQKVKGTKKKYKINGKTRFNMATSIYLSIITLNVNGLNALIKRHRVADWIKKIRAYDMLPKRDPL